MIELLKLPNIYKKDKIYHSYTGVCQTASKAYDRITRKAMLQQMIDTLTPEYICSICTIRELYFLRKLLYNESIDTKTYDFEIHALEEKFLCIDLEIPIELIENVKKAVSDEANFPDPKVELGIICCIGFIRSCGCIDLDMFQVICDTFGQDVHTVIRSTLVNFWVDYVDNQLIYRGYTEFYTSIKITRQIIEPHKVALLMEKSYISYFYNGYDETNPNVHAFFEKAKKLKMYDFMFYMLKNHVLLSCMDEDLIQSFIQDHKFSSELAELFKKAVVQMQSPVYYGLSYEDYEATSKMNDVLSNMDIYTHQTTAHLEDKDAKTFYKLYFGLLDFVNKKSQIVPNFPIKLGEYLQHDKISKVIDVLWNDCEMWIDSFCKENPLRLTPRNIRIIQSFKRGMRKEFIVLAFEKHYTVFTDEKKIYMVKGLFDNLEDVLEGFELPIFLKATLLPFLNTIVIDGLTENYTIQPGSIQTVQLYELYKNGEKTYRIE